MQASPGAETSLYLRYSLQGCDQDPTNCGISINRFPKLLFINPVSLYVMLEYFANTKQLHNLHTQCAIFIEYPYTLSAISLSTPCLYIYFFYSHTFHLLVL